MTRTRLARRRSRRRGTTLIELLVVVFLMGIVGIMILQQVSSSMAMAASTVNRTNADASARYVLDQTEIALKGSRPLGTCQYPVNGATPIASCLRVGERTFSLAWDYTLGTRGDLAIEPTTDQPATNYTANSGDTLCFYVYTQAGGNVNDVPDQECLFVRTLPSGSYVLELRKYAPSAVATYTSPSWSNPVAVRGRSQTGAITNDPTKLFGLNPAVTSTIGSVFRYYDLAGCEIIPAGPGGKLSTDATVSDSCYTAPASNGLTQVERVALVRMTPTFQYAKGTARGGAGTFGSDVYVQLMGSSYQRGVS